MKKEEKKICCVHISIINFTKPEINIIQRFFPIIQLRLKSLLMII